jgi:CdiI immunity protein
MTQKHQHEERPFDPADYPALREFFPAYLHQDFGDEYGSAAGAVKGFLGEVSGDEILQVKDEWKAFRGALLGRPIQEIQWAIGELGSAWQPQNEGELRELDEIFGRAKA